MTVGAEPEETQTDADSGLEQPGQRALVVRRRLLEWQLGAHPQQRSGRERIEERLRLVVVARLGVGGHVTLVGEEYVQLLIVPRRPRGQRAIRRERCVATREHDGARPGGGDRLREASLERGIERVAGVETACGECSHQPVL
jgi:hypothetical protein